ncbi:unnamed protein product [Musa hybrid cultivar]
MARILPKAAAAAAASIELAGLRSPFPSYSSSPVPLSTRCCPLLCSSPWALSSLRSWLRFAKTVDLIEARGTATRDTDFVKGGKTVIVFIKDPDYYKFELLERASTP